MRTISKADAEFMHQVLFVDITPSVNHANCLERETVRKTYGNVICGIRLHSTPPPPFISVLSSGLKVCMGNAQATMS